MLMLFSEQHLLSLLLNLSQAVFVSSNFLCVRYIAKVVITKQVSIVVIEPKFPHPYYTYLLNFNLIYSMTNSTRNQLYDVMGAVQTEHSHEAVLNVLSLTSEESSDFWERYLWSLSFGAYPSLPTIRSKSCNQTKCNLHLFFELNVILKIKTYEKLLKSLNSRGIIKIPTNSGIVSNFVQGKHACFAFIGISKLVFCLILQSLEVLAKLVQWRWQLLESGDVIIINLRK